MDENKDTNNDLFTVDSVDSVDLEVSKVNEVNKSTSKKRYSEPIFRDQDVHIEGVVYNINEMNYPKNVDRIIAEIIFNNNMCPKKHILETINIADVVFKSTIYRENKKNKIVYSKNIDGETNYFVDETYKNLFISEFHKLAELKHKQRARTNKNKNKDKNEIAKQIYKKYFLKLVEQDKIDFDKIAKNQTYEFNLNNFKKHNHDQYNTLINNVEQETILLKIAIQELDHRIYPDIKYTKYNDTELNIFSKRVQDIKKLNKITAEIETRGDEVKPTVTSIKYGCNVCDREIIINQKIQTIVKPNLCMECGNKTQKNFKTIKINRTDHLKFKVRELTSNITHKHEPKTLNCELKGSICDQDVNKNIYLGAKVELIGWLESRKEKNTIYEDYVFVVNNINFLDENIRKDLISEDDKNKIKLLKNDENLLEEFRESVFHRMAGESDLLKEVQKSLILQQCRGELDKQSHINITSNTSIGKSEIAKAIESISPRCEIVPASEISVPGLLGTCKKDEFTDQYTISPGAITRGNEGILVLEEADKMSDELQNSLLNPMTSGKVTIKKAASVDALSKTDTIMFGNPRGQKFNDEKQKLNQVPFIDTLKARFDLLFCISNENEFDDLREAKKISCMLSRESKPVVKKHSMEFVAKYLYYVRYNIKPKLFDDEKKHLITEIIKRRKSLGIHNNRYVETIHKISCWYSKFRQSEKIEIQDIDDALELHDLSLKTQNTTQFNQLDTFGIRKNKTEVLDLSE